MKDFTPFIVFSFLLIGVPAHAQDTIPSCVWGVSIYTGNTMLTEYNADGEVFITMWNANGTINTPRVFSGYYSVSHDTVTFTQDPLQQPCGTIPGVYIFNLDQSGARDTLIVTKVSDPCFDRVTWHSSWSRLPCWASPIVVLEEIATVSLIITIYPNPASHSITLENLRQPFDANTEVVLYDLLGNKLLQKHIGDAGNTYQLDVRHLNAGVYILQVAQDQEVIIMERIVIQK